MKQIATAIVCLALSIGAVQQAQAQERPKPDPVSKALEGWSEKETLDYLRNFNIEALVTGSPAALWYHRYASQTNKTAILVRRQPIMELSKAAIPGVGNVSAETALGTMTLDEYLRHPESYAQGFIVLHKGRIVYESYPGMRELDPHFWASNAKILASLAVDLLIDDGLIDEDQPLGTYVPEFRGTEWENVKVVDALDMSAGLDVSDDGESRLDPNSVIARLFRAELGEERDGKVEYMLDVMVDAERIEPSGKSWVYSSVTTQALVFLVEAVSGKSWSDFFEERVWSKMGVEGPLQVHLSPDGIAIVHGPVSSNLRDMARVGLLYTPSWHKSSIEQIVSPAILDRTQNTPRTRDFYLEGTGRPYIERLADETIRTGARQWDAIFEDGDLFKSGLNTQGIYVSPQRDLVIAYFSTDQSQGLQRYLRPIAKSGFFGK
ncbi:serine hydrolase domain-containing protein [Ruegeria lacuscaerulensis]|uniref:serine hydrolase domain-containing protein n=1 Tax=Ruegeria lacuscaerulensis TaxID=55218 RepID=UPI00147FF727|nr:serine hydrolase domain-containing protein [Ruegeria lacuscaerulensis]